MKKRGQLLGTPFIMIFALVVGGLILIGGLYYVYKIVLIAEKIDISKQVTDFKAKVRTYYYLEEGNKKTVTIPLPAKSDNICFYQSGKTWKLPSFTKGTAKINYPPDIETKENFYKSFFNSFKEKNMFVFPTEEFEKSAFTIPYLTLENQPYNPVCIRNGNSVRIVSMGDHVEIEVSYEAA